MGRRADYLPHTLSLSLIKLYFLIRLVNIRAIRLLFFPLQVCSISRGHVLLPATLHKIPILSAVLFFFFTTPCYAIDVTLEWNANSEPDLVGYKVYYDTDSGHPYYGIGSPDGDSPIDVGNVTRFTVTGLEDSETYYFAITAYSTVDVESTYSNQVATNNSDNEGGGGGCFIATAAFGSKMERQVQILSEFRDKRLLTNHFGRQFVDVYYTLSPPVAAYLRRHPTARAAVRYVLIPVTGVASLALHVNSMVLFLITAFLITGATLCCRRYRSAK
jgi:hypothetical protein